MGNGRDDILLPISFPPTGVSEDKAYQQTTLSGRSELGQ